MYNFENDIKNRLSDFEYDFKSEYWDSMEQKLNKAGSNNNGSVSKFGKLSSLGKWGNLFIYTSMVTVLITSVAVGLNLSSEDSQQKPIALVDETCGEEHFDLSLPQLADKSNELSQEVSEEMPAASTKQIAKVLQSNDNEISLVGEYQLNSSKINGARLGLRLEKKVDIDSTKELKSSKTVAEVSKIPNPQHLTKDNKTDTTNTKKMRVIVKEEKVKRPMAKPDKRVFGKRRGLLYRLGLRR